MAVFDSFADTPGQIRIEGEQITLTFDRLSETEGRLTWNIPPPANGCTSETQAYCGIIVTIDNIPSTVATAPVDGVKYTADPTADPDLHAGDKIGTSLVIGAFYEGIKKGRGEPLTTTFDITGLNQETGYYVAAYAVDCPGRYHTQGVFAYSQPFGNAGTPDTPGSQELILDEGTSITDGTGLDVDSSYTLEFTIDGVEYSITIDGADAQTYQQLIDKVNEELSKLTPAPQSPLAPGTGLYYYDKATDKLFQWDGEKNVELAVLNEPTDPSALAVGDYWYNTQTKVLYQWDGTDWVEIPESNIICYTKDLTKTDELTSDDHWYQNSSPSRAFSWCGNVWCEKTLFDQEETPTNGITPNCGTYWYNPDDMILRQWNDRDDVWTPATAIYWNVDPNFPGSPTLEAGTYWFNEVDQQLYRWSSPVANMWTNVAFGYQDVLLTTTKSLNDLALPEGTYTDDVVVNGNTITLTLTICNETEGKFINVFNEINQQFTGSPAEVTVAFREDGTGMAIRLTSSTIDSPEIQAGGDLFSSIIDFSSTTLPVNGTFITVGTEPELTAIVPGQYWVNTTTNKVFQRDLANTEWNRLCAIFFDKDPTDRESCDLWWNSDTDILSVWDAVGNMWVSVVEFIQSTVDPVADKVIEIGALWYQASVDTLYEWDGTQWSSVSFVKHPTDPTMPDLNDVWKNGDEWFYWNGTEWVCFDPVNSPDNPSQATIPTGTYWYDTTHDGLFKWNGSHWVSLLFETQNPTPAVGTLWYDLSTDTLREWNGTSWIPAVPIGIFSLYSNGNLRLTSTTTGSSSVVSMNCDIYTSTLIAGLNARCGDIICGTDGLSGVPSYLEQDVGTDGSSDELREMHDIVRRLLGYPIIDVELDKEQMNLAIKNSIGELRRISGSGYRRGFMKLYLKRGRQRYQLSNKGKPGGGYERPDGTYVGYNNIAQVMGVFKTTGAFMTSAYGGGIFGQVVLQHLYNMGTFDLLSFHLVAQYIEQLEHLFASRITFNWNETDRTLWLHQAFSHDQLALMDVTIERTDQDLLTDRFTRLWIERYAVAEAKLMLAQIRGKFSTLPGAGGGISLNAADLQTQAMEEMDYLRKEVENMVVNNVEEYGMHTTMIIG